MRSTDDQSTIRWLPVVGLYCFRGLKIDFNQNLSLCDRCTKSVRVHLLGLHLPDLLNNNRFSLKHLEHCGPEIEEGFLDKLLDAADNLPPVMKEKV